MEQSDLGLFNYTNQKYVTDNIDREDIISANLESFKDIYKHMYDCKYNKEKATTKYHHLSGRRCYLTFSTKLSYFSFYDSYHIIYHLTNNHGCIP